MLLPGTVSPPEMSDSYGPWYQWRNSMVVSYWLKAWKGNSMAVNSANQMCHWASWRTWEQLEQGYSWVGTASWRPDGGQQPVLGKESYRLEKLLKEKPQSFTLSTLPRGNHGCAWVSMWSTNSAMKPAPWPGLVASCHPHANSLCLRGSAQADLSKACHIICKKKEVVELN